MGRTTSIMACATLLLAMAASSCGKGEPAPYSHEAARLAAEDCYRSLVNGDYGRYISYLDVTDSIPSDYSAELEDMAAQSMARQGECNAIVGVSSLTDSLFADSTADVFLDILFADSTHEVVCLPMVLRSGRWLVR
ncbi:MAG: hypothetical protein ACI3X7_01900 [Bacteroidaceae bacterium]